MELDSKYKPKKLSIKRKKIDEFIIDETLIKVVGSFEYIWLWGIAIELESKKEILLDV